MTGRAPTMAHPLCTCVTHAHGDGHCVGTQLLYEDASGETHPGPCMILGAPVLPDSRRACPVHGGQW